MLNHVQFWKFFHIIYGVDKYFTIIYDWEDFGNLKGHDPYDAHDALRHDFYTHDAYGVLHVQKVFNINDVYGDLYDGHHDVFHDSHDTQRPVLVLN